MKKSAGLLVALEGSDGSGKTTQLKLLTGRLKAVGHDVAVYDFPRYSERSSFFVQRYLDGEYGPAAEVSPYTASLFYALDRIEAAPQIRQDIAEGKIVLANRYTGSNMAHQGSKFSASGEQRGFFMWVDSLEYELLGIPRPKINIFLRVPVNVSTRLLAKRGKHASSGKASDEHEADKVHQQRAILTFDNLCRLFPKDFKVIECVEDRRMRPITEINNQIWQALQPLLPKPTHRPTDKVVKLSSNDAYPPKDTSGGIGHKDLKDISLLAVNSLLSATVPQIDYRLEWPPKKPARGYYIPPQFGPELRQKYSKTMDKLSAAQTQMKKVVNAAYKKPATKDDAERAAEHIIAAVPMASLVNPQIAAADNLDALVNRARVSPLPELEFLAKRQLSQGASQPQELRKIIKQLAGSRQPLATASSQTVHLIDFWPRNEFDLLIERLFLDSDLTRDEITSELDRWPYERKANALRAAADHQPDLLLKKARYRFDIISELPVLSTLTQWLQPSEFELQLPTPLYGYAVPSELELLGLDSQFIECFDLSLELFNDIQKAGHSSLASYAALAGHRQHCQITVSGDRLFKQYSAAYKKTVSLLRKLKQAAAEVHPLAAGSLRPEDKAIQTPNNQQHVSKTDSRKKLK